MRLHWLKRPRILDVFDRSDLQSAWQMDFHSLRQSLAIELLVRSLGASDFFHASETWLRRFKKTSDYTSRKVTGYASKAEEDKREEIDRSRANFLENFERLEAMFPRRLIWNTDQTGFNYEISNKRIISRKGERDTILNVDSKSKTTHSYTSQLTISRDGRTIGKLLLCLREPRGVFGPRVQQQVEALERQFGNIRVFASQSGKMTSALIADWLREVILPAIPQNMEPYDGDTDTSSIGTVAVDDNAVGEYIIDEEQRSCHRRKSQSHYDFCMEYPSADTTADRCRASAETQASKDCLEKPDVLLIHDSWSGQTSDSLRRALQLGRIRSLIIPPHTTAVLQPLDVTFNRQYKKFAKRITEEALYARTVRNITDRDGVINMHSLIWNQFSAPAYQDLLRYAWHNTDTGFSPAELAVGPPPRTVQDIQFSFNASSRCQVDNCTAHAFIKCAHCGKLLCLHHFLERECFHNEETNAGAGPSGLTRRPSPNFDQGSDSDDY